MGGQTQVTAGEKLNGGGGRMPMRALADVKINSSSEAVR